MYCFTVSLTISIIIRSNFCRNCHIFPMYRYFLLSLCFILACSFVDVFLIIFTYSSNNNCLIYFVLCRFLKYLELEKSCWIVLIWMDSAKGTYMLVLVLLFSSFYSFFLVFDEYVCIPESWFLIFLSRKNIQKWEHSKESTARKRGIRHPFQCCFSVVVIIFSSAFLSFLLSSLLPSSFALLFISLTFLTLTPFHIYVIVIFFIL